ncbi:nucleoside phosphorylase domain-containing protein [Trichoderma sp. SZMC 28011]
MASLPSVTKSFKEYTIGWICALPLEAAAATAMLDDEHKKPFDFIQPRQDTNVYTWGNIDVHNVVIASLPAGEYGTTSASNVATTLLMSFPEVRFGLMVGIGAGVPRQDRDIRLGDVVVSEPKGTSGGVVQYDFVKAIQNVVDVLQGGTLKRMGMLNRPPTVLLNAVSALKKQHEMRGITRIPEFLRAMLKRNPGMREAYVYQEAHNDRLFEDSYGHTGDGDCASTCDLNKVKPRNPRVSENPKIHYGVIASRNTLVKDASTRKVLALQTGEDCICFEMEAAGLMNTFPCLVIRGICDYADSHKNDTWQRYAAATAAACAKELFQHIPAQELTSSPPAHDVLRQSGESHGAPAVVAPSLQSSPLTAIPTAQQSPSYFSPPAHQQSGPDLSDLIAQVAQLNHRIQNLKATDLAGPPGSKQPVTPPATPRSQSEPQLLQEEVKKLDSQIADIEKLIKGLSARAPPSTSTNQPPVTADRSSRGGRPSTGSVGIFSRTSLDESFTRDPDKFRRVIEQFFRGPWPRFLSDWGASRLKRIEKEVMQPLGIQYSIRYRDTAAWTNERLPLNERLRDFISSLDSAADPKSLPWKVYNQSILSLSMVCEDYLGHEIFRR